jgi:hypothetical protein
MTRLHLPDDDDDMTKNKKEEGYVRVRRFVGTHICGDGCVFRNHRHIVIRARNSFTFIGLGNDDQPMTMAVGAPFRLSFDGRGTRGR